MRCSKFEKFRPGLVDSCETLSSVIVENVARITKKLIRMKAPVCDSYFLDY